MVIAMLIFFIHNIFTQINFGQLFSFFLITFFLWYKSVDSTLKANITNNLFLDSTDHRSHRQILINHCYCYRFHLALRHHCHSLYYTVSVYFWSFDNISH